MSESACDATLVLLYWKICCLLVFGWLFFLVGLFIYLFWTQFLHTLRHLQKSAGKSCPGALCKSGRAPALPVHRHLALGMSREENLPQIS